MSELTLTVIRLAFLALLWIFVLMAVSVMRSDLFGTRVSSPARPGTARRTPGRAAAERTPRPAKPRKGTPGRLVVTDGSLAGTSVTLGSAPVVIGRSQDATLVITDDYASGHHARIFPQDGQWLLEDLGSTNGTYLDRQRVTAPVPVPLGIPIRIGKTVLEVRK
ncbi:MAG: FHA domain-containing protein FhaB/FipA [Actinomycetes bacterium]